MNSVPEIVVLYCGNTVHPNTYPPEGWVSNNGYKSRFIRIPCNKNIEPVNLLKLFGQGVDGIMVVACAQNNCRFLFGSAGAQKRLGYTGKLLEETGLGTGRLLLIAQSGLSSADLNVMAGELAKEVSKLGLNSLKPAPVGAR